MLKHLLVIFILASGLNAAEIKWAASLDEAKKESLAKRLPLLEVHYIEKDEVCDKFLNGIKRDEFASGKLKEFVCVKIEESKNKDNYKEYPVARLLTPAGNEFLLKRMSGKTNLGMFANSVEDMYYKVVTVNGAKFEAPVKTDSPSVAKGKPVRFRYATLERGYCLVRVYDSKGILVKKLFAGVQKPGTYTAEWDQKDKAGAPAVSGRYTFVFDLASNKDIVEVEVE